MYYWDKRNYELFEILPQCEEKLILDKDITKTLINFFENFEKKSISLRSDLQNYIEYKGMDIIAKAIPEKERSMPN